MKKYGIYVHLGKRLWDIDLTSIEMKKLYDQGILEKDTYIKASLVLKREYREEEKRESERNG